MRTSVALIGFMGAGKTAVGRELAARLGKEFIDLDTLIEQKAGRTIPDIFREDGEIAFRELEIDAARELGGRKNTVIACGGGIVLNKINVDRLKKECIIVYLKASPSALLRRTSGDKTGRPLLPKSGRAAEIRALLGYRRPYYERAADITIDTSRTGVEAVVRKIMEELDGYEGNG